MIYLATSALGKLVLPEAESEALTSWLSNRLHLIRTSSEIVHVELLRAVLRTDPDGVAKARQLLRKLHKIPLTLALLEQAGTTQPPQLRSLDSIHLASALEVKPELTAFVAYDRRLTAAAETHGLPVVAPG